jgi:hypothetical protein
VPGPARSASASGCGWRRTAGATPKAWSAWSSDDDGRLLDGYRSGMDVGQLAAELGRKPGAILSRLVKHGVIAHQET